MTGRPPDLADRPDCAFRAPERSPFCGSIVRGGLPMDALSDVLRAVRLTGAIFFDVHASEPWVAETPPGASIVGRMFPGAEHLVSYHVMTHGSCWATVHGGTPIRLSAGDIVVFPQGDAHAMSSTPGMRKAPDVAMYRPPTRRTAALHDLGGRQHARNRRASSAGFSGATRGRSIRCWRRCRPSSASATARAGPSTRSSSSRSPSRRNRGSAANACSDVSAS